MPDQRKPIADEEIRRLIAEGAHDHAASGDTAGRGATEGDWRGPYGYGHRAYRPDPQAHYAFDPGPPRTLPPAEPPPPEPKVLWKRPMR
jgi:hypothetical protein